MNMHQTTELDDDDVHRGRAWPPTEAELYWEEKANKPVDPNADDGIGEGSDADLDETPPWA